jgi:hypothetical protein
MKKDQFLRDLEPLRRPLAELCSLVRLAVGRSAQAFSQGDGSLAGQIAGWREKIRRREAALEGEWLRALALGRLALEPGPAAAPLRILYGLGRIADHAHHLSGLAPDLGAGAAPERLSDLEAEVALSERLLTGALGSLLGPPGAHAFLEASGRFHLESIAELAARVAGEAASLLKREPPPQPAVRHELTVSREDPNALHLDAILEADGVDDRFESEAGTCP